LFWTGSFLHQKPGWFGLAKFSGCSNFRSGAISCPILKHWEQPKCRAVYNFNVVLLDPSDDSIPRSSVRQDLLNTGRIVKISLGRGTQEAGSLRALNGAFPFLKGATAK